ncbi:c-type cytochrome [Pseudoxanthomonas beigongshangi]
MNNRNPGLLALAAVVLVLAACSGQAPESADAADAAESAPVVASETEAAPAEAPAADATVAAADSAPAADAAGHPGEETYKKTCAMCHSTTALGAPMVGDKADWSARAAQGADTLHNHALEGFNGAKGVMPARGGNPSLDDDAVKAAVDYMVSKSK